MASLGFEKVSKRFPDGTLALSQVDLEVAEGEFMVLVGPSGCGKTTLLRSAAGLEEITSGDIRLGGRIVTDVEPGDRDVAMVFQNYALYPHMTVRQNLAFGLEQRRLPRDEIARRVATTAATLGLDRLLDRKPAALSGGQRQRVAMGRAIVREPACFLMDEPLSNLDANLRVQMRSELKLLNAKLGVTTLYVTHDQVEAMTMGDRVAVLSPVYRPEDHNLQQCAPPAELYDKPANLFVAGFIGSPAMNFIRARLERGNGGPQLVVAGLPAPLPVGPEVAARRPGLAKAEGRTVILGIRPEFFAIEPDGRGDLAVEVLMVEMTGADGYLHFRLAAAPGSVESGLPEDETIPGLGQQVTARIEPRLLPRAGSRVALKIDFSRVHFFDPDSGQAIR
jgi:multiple sugar transport system ATP-binding protein